MKKICHIRGRKDYAKDEDYNLKGNHMTISILYDKHDLTSDNNNVLRQWERALNYNYFHFRRQVRNICIDNIKKTDIFDEICESDEEFLQYIETLSNNENILYYAQDDDDIFIGNAICNNTYSDNGLYLYPALKISPHFIKKQRITVQDKKFEYIDFFLPTSRNPKITTPNQRPRTCNSIIINNVEFFKNKNFIRKVITKLYNVQAPVMKYHVNNKLPVICDNRVLKEENILSMYFFQISSLSNIKYIRNATLKHKNCIKDIQNYIKEDFMQYFNILNNINFNNNCFNKIKNTYNEVYKNI
tara:strand:- start:457 stop:1359 length:903 start_codon:yes stop_codon:yes gene_type:complete